jgi:predicted outer membrane repeat protein
MTRLLFSTASTLSRRIIVSTTTLLLLLTQVSASDRTFDVVSKHQRRSNVLDCKPLREETWDALVEFIGNSSGFADVCPFTIRGSSACPPSTANNDEGCVVQSDADLYLSCDPYQFSSDSKCVIDCPMSRYFTVRGSLSIENFVLRQASNTSIYVEEGGRLSVLSSILENNNAVALSANSSISNKNSPKDINTSRGGAIFSGPNSFTEVQYSEFRSNQASAGGAIFAAENSMVRLTHCDFWGNFATIRGGAVAITDTSGTAEVTMKVCTFVQNEADDGGAIYSGGNQSTLSVSSSHFSKNVALNGGALDYSGLVDVSDSSFINNEALNWGGAINAGIAGIANIRRTMFANNVAMSNGPAINDRHGSQITVRDNSGCGNTVSQGRQCDGVLIWLSERRLLCRSFSEECTTPPTPAPTEGSATLAPTTTSPTAIPTVTVSDMPSTLPSQVPPIAATGPTSPSATQNSQTTSPSEIPSDEPSLVPSSGPGLEQTLPVASNEPSQTRPSIVSPSPTPTSPGQAPSDFPSLAPSQVPSDLLSLVPGQVATVNKP